MRHIGDRVRVQADNFSIEGTITEIRLGVYPYRILTDDGQETWYAAFEVFDL